MGRGSIVDDPEKEVAAFVANLSFRLTYLTNISKKKKEVAVEESKYTTTLEAPTKKKRTSVYNVYKYVDRLRYFHFIQVEII